VSLEIEKKFLLTEYPEKWIDDGSLSIRSDQRIEQTYLAMDESQELRVRRITDLGNGGVTYKQTFKRGNGLVREEIEYEISEGIYEQVMQAFGVKPLIKRRVTVEWKGMGIEIDCYEHIALIVAEVEFGSVEAANAFAGPEWFGRDISAEREFSNKKLWKELQLI
jgi:CYTH domain-containing protein